MRTIIIGVTGASSSGKSTISYLLRTILPNAQIIHEDDFFKQEADVPYDTVRKDRDWDCPDAIDIDLMKQTLRVLQDPKAFDSCPRAAVEYNNAGYYDYSVTSTEPPRNDVNFKSDNQLIEKLRIEAKNRIKNCFGNQTVRIFLLDGFLLLHDVKLLELLDISLFFRTDYYSLKARRESRVYTVEGTEWVDPPGYFDSFVWPGYYKYHRDCFINGDDESCIKATGGILKDCLKNKYNIYEFENNDNSDPNKLIQDVTATVLNKIL